MKTKSWKQIGTQKNKKKRESCVFEKKKKKLAKE